MKLIFPPAVFVTGIGTGVGKSVCAAVLAEALQADYWKPVQSGNEEGTDSDTVKTLLSNSISRIHPEAYSLRHPSSPHYAARLEHTTIDMNRFALPATPHRLVIEGAGGLMVPLNAQQLMIDLMAHLKVPVIVVAQNYLGSINHTLLSIEVLKQRNIPLLGLLFNGSNFLDNEEIITHFSGTPRLGQIETATELNKEFIARQAENLRIALSKYFQW